ncbi:phosphatase PAP2 family protein [Stenotrophomonas sp. YIM B06876]|uniref:phosphatase PAP2 family protein n=1 Tax=Stenotrophomonas sp. YIM B06876 TaxID=3060211 RepID=UPI0027385171|nr:phosphatase PAP2 family protein [Stenotrophomonas sp. YIM B06876]
MRASADNPIPEEAAGFRHWLRRNSWRFVLLFVGVLLPLAVFVALADEIHEFEAFHFDHALLWRMHAMASPRLDAGVVWISRLGYQWGVIPLDMLLVALLLARRHWREGSFAAIAVVGSALLNLASKPFFQRDRPGLWESIAPESSFSFPSGHAMGSMTLVAILVLLAWPTCWRWPVLLLGALFAVLVGFSRVYLGVHYPSDILGGWCAGLAWVVGVYLLLFRRRAPWSAIGR